MKEVLTIILVLVITGARSQNEVKQFEFSPEGINGYVVVDFPEMSAEEIYINLKKWAEYNIRSAEYSNYSTIENEFLSYHFIIPEAIIHKSIIDRPYDLEMDVLYRIKEGRLRIDLENIVIPHSVQGPPLHITGSRSFSQSFYDKKGRERRQFRDDKEQGEKVLNDLVREIEMAIKQNPDYKTSDW